MKLLLLGLIAMADTSHTFQFQLGRSQVEITSYAPTREEAFSKAAAGCYIHFRNEIKAKTGERLTEDQGLDIIDSCANPKKY